MFTAGELQSEAQQALDAEASQRYLDDPDWIPAMNSAMQRGVSACNWALENVKGSAEQLIELKQDSVFQSNYYGGISINSAIPSVGHTLWSVLAVYAEPVLFPSSAAPIGSNQQNTIYFQNYIPLGSDFPVEQMTAEHLAIARTNMFMSGNEKLAATPMRTYGYYYMGRRGTQNLINAQTGEILITPVSISRQKLFWVSYLRTPDPITSMSSEIPFPPSFKRTMADWTLQYIVQKIGDQTTVYQTAEKDARELFQLTTT